MTEEITPDQYEKFLAEAAADDYRCTVCGYNDLPILPLAKGGFVCAACYTVGALPKEHFEALDKERSDNEEWKQSREVFKFYDPDLDWYRYILTGEELQWEHTTIAANRKAFGQHLKEETLRAQAEKANEEGELWI